MYDTRGGATACVRAVVVLEKRRQHFCRVCPDPEKDDADPTTPLAGIRCCGASELDSLSSCCTLTCGGGSLVEPVKRKI